MDSFCSQTKTHDGIPYAIAHCHACFDLHKEMDFAHKATEFA